MTKSRKNRHFQFRRTKWMDSHGGTVTACHYQQVGGSNPTRCRLFSEGPHIGLTKGDEASMKVQVQGT
jgi:hypothetical protein